VDRAGQLVCRYQPEVVPARRDDLVLQPPRGAETGDAQVRIMPPQTVREREQRVDVPSGPAPRQDDRPQLTHGPLLSRLRRRGNGGSGAQSSRTQRSGGRACSARAASGSARANEASRPTAASVTISALPPSEMNGSGSPVI